MKNEKYSVKHPNLKGSEQHHPLKNEPGEAGDAEHAESGATAAADIEEAVDKSDGQTQIADALRDVAAEKGEKSGSS